MPRLSLNLSDPQSGRVIMLPWQSATQATMETDEHGCAALSVTLPRIGQRAVPLVDDGMGLHLSCTAGGMPLWAGRVEEPGISLDADRSELTVTAYGYQQAFDDIPYTALWSDSSYDHWQYAASGSLTNGAEQPITAGRFTHDTDGRLWLSPMKNQANGYAAHTYAIPAGSTRQITSMTFDYALFAPVGWQAHINTIDAAGTTRTNRWFLTATGALQTGTTMISMGASDRISASLWWTGAAATNAGENDQYYFRLINVKVTTGTVTGDAIVRDMLTAVRAVNPSQLSATTSQIRATELTLPDEVYLDANMRDVLDTIASYGTGEMPPQRLAWRVWADQVLRLETLDSGSITYTVSVGSYQADRALRQTYPQIYASYQDSNDQRQVTATASASTTTPRIIRRLAVQSSSTTSAQAIQERDAALADQGDPLPRVSMTIARLTDANGARVPNYRLRAGDVVQVRDLAPTLSTRVDRFRSFRVIHTSYDLLADTVDVELESPQPRLDWLLARREIGA